MLEVNDIFRPDEEDLEEVTEIGDKLLAQHNEEIYVIEIVDQLESGSEVNVGVVEDFGVDNWNDLEDYFNDRMTNLDQYDSREEFAASMIARYRVYDNLRI